MVMDTFRDHVVERVYTNNPAVDAIKAADVQAWLALMGTFKVDPLAPFKSMPGPVGSWRAKRCWEKAPRKTVLWLRTTGRRLHRASRKTGVGMEM